jgi:hypothetical protein
VLTIAPPPVRDRGLADVDRRHQVDVDQRLEVLRRRLARLAARERRDRAAGDVDDDVDPAQL